MLTYIQVLTQQGQAQQMFFTKKQVSWRRAFKNGFFILSLSFSQNQGKENTFQLGYHDSHRREQAGNHSTSISITDSILRLPTNTSLWEAFSCSLISPGHAVLKYRPCPTSWASQVQGVTSALLGHQQRQTGRLCSLTGFSAKTSFWYRKRSIQPSQR